MIEVRDLTMCYGRFTALNQISFEAKSGEVLGLLGPNGAGKTTAMRILTTYLYPTAGTATVEGIDILADPIAVRKNIGYLPETVPLYPEMQTDEYLRFVGTARGLSGVNLDLRMAWVKDECGLRSIWKHAICEISKGFKQRVGLAQALIHDPKVLILDEPTTGLDPLQIIGIRKLVKSLAKDKTIIFSTHVLQEVESLADRVVIINEGKIVAQGTQPELAAQVSARGGTKSNLSFEEIFISLLTPSLGEAGGETAKA